jgi:hypothetical protein
MTPQETKWNDSWTLVVPEDELPEPVYDGKMFNEPSTAP